MDSCPQCGKGYKSLSSHWNQSSCERPNFTNHQREIIVGLLMGDGYITMCGKNPLLECEMISKNYLEHIDKQFGIFSNGVSLSKTAKENAKQSRENGFSPNAKEENYNDVYRWYSMTHPKLQEFLEWYSTGEKVWPKNIELTPTALKHWYCGDGSRDSHGSHNYIRIAMANEVENRDKVNKIFENSGLPSPNNYNINKNNCIAQFTVDQSEELWEYMGEPLPDFRYKWPKEF